MARLLIRGTGTGPKEIELQPGTHRLGRSEDNDFQIDDASVSSLHCEIEVRDGQVFVRDLGSTNGTYINSSPIVEAPLYPGETLRLGVVNLVYQREAGAAYVPRTQSRVVTPPVAGSGKSKLAGQTGVIAKLAEWRRFFRQVSGK